MAQKYIISQVVWLEFLLTGANPELVSPLCSSIKNVAHAQRRSKKQHCPPHSRKELLLSVVPPPTPFVFLLCQSISL